MLGLSKFVKFYRDLNDQKLESIIEHLKTLQIVRENQSVYISNTYKFFYIKYSTGMLMRLSCMPVRLSVCLSFWFYHNSRISRRRILKLGTYILEVKSKIEFAVVSRTWPMARLNWRFSECTFRVHVRLNSVHCTCTHSWGIFVYMYYSSLLRH